MSTKTRGIERRFDKLGRIVVPIEMRKSLGIEPEEPVEIAQVGKTVVLRKLAEPCGSCGGTGTA